MNTTIKVPRYQLAVVNELLSGQTPCDEGDGFLLMDLTEYFTDGYRVNAKVVSGGVTGERDACLPYCDVVLFDEGGNEVEAIGAERSSFDGEYWFGEDGEHVCWIEGKD
jgi:hypothetical protein